MSENPAIIVCGNLSDGFRFYGPFPSFDDAANVAQDMDERETWIATLEQLESGEQRREVTP